MGIGLSETWWIVSPKSAIMRLYFENWNNIATDLIDNLDKFGFKRTNFLEADKIITWNDVMPDQISLIEYARKRNIKVIVLQHGSKGTSRYYSPFNQPVLADKICVWGENMKKRLLEVGTLKEKIAITGTPIFSHLKPNIQHEGINIIFSPEHWEKDIPENRDTANKLRKLKGINIITKILPMHNKWWYDNPIMSDRNDPKHFEIVADILSKADLVVGVMEGTFELLAQSLDIPVVIMKDWKPKSISGDDRYLKYNKRLSFASKETTLETLNETILQQLKNPDELKEQRKQEAIMEGGVNIENPLEEISKVIKNA